MSEKKENPLDLVRYEPGSLEVPANYAEEFGESSSENLTGVRAALPKIQMPTGRGDKLSFQWPGEEPEDKEEALGVILYMTPAKAFWLEQFGGGDAVIPDCASHDGIIPSQQYPHVQAATCAECKNNRFGTKEGQGGKKGRGKACRDVKRVVFARVDRPELPALLNVPPGSIKAYDEFMIRLRMLKRPYWSVVTKLSLGTVKNRDGIDYPMLEFEAIGGINKSEDIEVIKHQRNQWIELLKHTMFETVDKDQVASEEPVSVEPGYTPPAGATQEF